MERFDDFFERLSGSGAYRWQQELADQDECANRLICIPTGFGKTLGVLAAWIWHRVIQRNDNWPRRLVWCLPMRVLVEQTESEVRSALQRLEVLWNEQEGTHDGKVGVHLLMGGANAGQWHLYPECDAVLIGTQDMLLSRALNHGYASPRARWPVEFGLLNHDALWVMDEVQLMDVGLATSGQLQVFRDEDKADGKSLRPCFSWWMSATLQRTWLEKSPDTESLVGELDRNTHRIEAVDRTGHLWDDVVKPLERRTFDKPTALADKVSQRHRGSGCSNKGPTLVVLNTVKWAVEVWKALGRDRELKKAGTDIRLIHSRFRPHERENWRKKFLNRETCGPGTDRIIVATQVVEAGVDISASLLVTELAPWPSLVQRFGRCARWGGTGQVLIADFDHKNDKQAAPYAVAELEAAREACNALPDVGPTHLEQFEEEHQTLLPRLYPYEPKHLLLRHELDELFDTSPDLSGADIDISRFIRSGEERDVQVFWSEVGTDKPPASLKPTRDELCSVPFLRAREWLFPSTKPGLPAWVWDWLSCKWRQAKTSDIYPGQTVLVDSGVGGYRHDSGWDPKSPAPVRMVFMPKNGCFENKPCWKRDGNGWTPSKRRVPTFLPKEDDADAAEEDESLSVIDGWQTIASHGLQVGTEVERIADQIVPTRTELQRLLQLAGRWHDLGKAHPAFQGSIKADDRPEGNDIAKAPDRAWPCSSHNMYCINVGDQRRGFRHELASTLGLFGVLQRHEPQHPALLGPWGALFKAMGKPDLTRPTELARPTELEREILNLDADDFDLLAYLVCAHHGKVRMTWHASQADQEANDRQLRIRGIRQGDELPSVLLATVNGEVYPLPDTALDLSPSETGLSPRTGRSWTERVLNLLACHGPFTLAWLEALLRAADQRASRPIWGDTLLQEQEESNAEHHLDEGRRKLAPPPAGRAAAPAPGGNSPSCGQLHGHGRRAGGRGMDPETTRPPDSGTTHPPAPATRYFQTHDAILKYQDLVPLLGERVAETELSIYDREFAAFPLHDLLLQLHRCICRDLIPEIAGRWRRQDVRVGEDHEPPPHWKVPMLMRSYADDLEARLTDLTRSPGEEKAITDLTFAEGQLLHIHPFKDFNGRVSRLFLIELLCRLDLSVIASSIASPAPEGSQRYFAALRAYDRHDRKPLIAIWRRRFTLETDQ